jgi:hypothetical protein
MPANQSAIQVELFKGQLAQRDKTVNSVHCWYQDWSDNNSVVHLIQLAGLSLEAGQIDRLLARAGPATFNFF